jgi:hypothetical protein
VPANASAIVAKAIPGEELTCKAHSFKVCDRGGQLERGVLSYYAVESLDRADTMGAWLAATREAIESSRRDGRLKPFQAPLLQALGDPAAEVPGRPVSAE